MNGSAPGLWDIADAALRSIGKGVAWLAGKKIGREEEYAAYAMIGGALLCAVFGTAVGFVLLDLSRSAAIAGAIVGGLLGMCMGIFFGASIDAVDCSIQATLKALKQYQMEKKS